MIKLKVLSYVPGTLVGPKTQKQRCARLPGDRSEITSGDSDRTPFDPAAVNAMQEFRD